MMKLMMMMKLMKLMREGGREGTLIERERVRDDGTGLG